MFMKQKGFSLPETLIIGAVIVLIGVLGTGMFATERARLRDAKRMADITRLAGGFAVLYAQTGSYTGAAAGCSKVGSNAASCTLPSLLGGNDQLQDPSKYSYTVQRVPDQLDFGIRFTLERSYGSLTAGAHILSKQGVR